MTRSISLFAALSLLLVACLEGATVDPADTTTGSSVADPEDTTASRIDLEPAPGGGESLPRGMTAGLRQVDDCDVLLDYFIDRALDQVGPWGLGSSGEFRRMADTTAAAAEDSAVDGGSRSASEPSSTNVQVQGVDEGDIVKASGDLLFVLSNDRLLVFSTEGEGIEELGTMRLPEGSGSGEMLLEGDRLVVVGAGFDATPRPIDTLESDAIAPVGSPLTDVTLVDISDPTDPTVLRRLTVDGSAVTTRLVEGHLRVILEAYPVGLDWAHPEGSGLRAEREATERNRQIIRESTIENWLPYYVTDAGDDGTLMDCGDVLLPPEPAGLGTLTILDFELADGIEDWNAASVVASGSTVYANTERTYVATSRWLDPAAIDSPESFEGHLTQIHRFDTPVEGELSYVASGEVDGFLLNQFAMDEHASHLRVASTSTPGWWGEGGESESRVTVLGTEGNSMEVVGVVDGLGVTETIRAVRFMGPVGYVVTFRQTDPLYVIDLSDPADPVAAGELKIPGYSAYLHPVADGRLLGVGQDADPETGAVHGLQLSLFDVSDPTDPTRIDTFGLDSFNDGRDSEVWSPIEGDHKAFTEVDDGAFVPYEGWSWSRDAETETVRFGLIDVDWSGDTLDGSRVLPIVEGKATGELWGFNPRRTVAKGDLVYAVGHAGISVLHAPSGEVIDQLRF